MNIARVLETQGIPYQKNFHEPVFTAQSLAVAEHVSGYMVAKPVIVKGKEGYAMCVVPAPMHLDLVRAGRVLNDPDLRLASEDELTGLFPECEPGAEPPIGSLFRLRTVIDKHLRDSPVVIMQAGTHSESIRLREEDWEKLCRPIIAAIAS